MSYTGRYELSVDPKGRVVVPAAFRDDFGDGSQISMRRDHITLYGKDGWDAFITRFRELRSIGTVSSRGFMTIMASSAPVHPDTQGRFGLPQRFRDAHGIGGQVVVIGHDDHLAIYHPDRAPALAVGDELAAFWDEFEGLPL